MFTLSPLLTPRIPSLSRVLSISLGFIRKAATPANLALIGWSVIATTTGSVALLSLMIAVRGYIASRSLGRQIETARAEYRDTGSLSKMRVAAIGLTTCWLVGAILSLPETGFAAEIPVSPVSPPNMSAIPIISPFPTVADISADILADHLGQRYITLEQMMRRVEGLRAGVSLDNTASIANISLQEALYDEWSPIRDILEARGHAVNELGLEKVARRLRKEEIEAVIGEYMHSLELPLTDSSIPVSMSIPEHQTSLSPLESSIPLTNPSIWEWVVPVDSLPIKSNVLSTIGIIWALAVSGYVGHLLYKSRKNTQTNHTVWVPTLFPPGDLAKDNKVTPEPVNIIEWNTTPETPELNRNSPPTSFPSEVANYKPIIPVNIEENLELPLYSLTLKQRLIQTKSSQIFSEVFGWVALREEGKTTPEYHIDVHSGETLGWSFKSFTKHTPKWVEFIFLWFDGNAARKHVSKSYTRIDYLMNQDGRELVLQRELKKLYLEMLEMREALKQEDMQHITNITLTQKQLQQIYRHVDQKVVKNTEILGYWLSSMYLIQDGNLPVLSMNNPGLDEQIVTWIDCKLQNLQLATKYNFTLPNHFIRQCFPEKESNFLIKEREEALSSLWKVRFSWAVTTENWHKHPSSLLYPSSGDTWQAVNDIDIQYPGRRSYLYTIVVKQTGKKMTPDTCVVKLNKTIYGGDESYEFRSFIMEYPEQGTLPTLRQLKINIA